MKQRLEWLDALRGIASLGVVFFHAMLPLWMGATELAKIEPRISLLNRLGVLVTVPFHYGQYGVELFFVLSGFVIHLPYADPKRTFSFSSYAIRRFFRLYPPYLLSIVLTLSIAQATQRPWHLGDPKVLKSLFLVQNYPHPTGPTQDLSTLQVGGNLALWTLPVEFELYLAYPLLLIALKRFGIRTTGIGIAAISVTTSLVNFFVGRSPAIGYEWAHYIPTFLPFLVIWSAGAWLADAVVNKRVPKWSGLFSFALILAVCALIAARLSHAPGDLANFAAGAVSTLLILAFLNHRRLIDVFDSKVARPLYQIGTFSYSLYLIHAPFFLLVAYYIVTSGTRTKSPWVSIAVAISAVPLSYIFYRVCEKPSIRLARHLSRRGHTIESRNAA